ncbi:MAG: hypothetical protein JW986_01310 [Methanotrichaceae archaeon]|nr:hypothetical protein [Methanotrichaceae archaeon]
MSLPEQSVDSIDDAMHSIESIYEALGSDQRELLHRLAALSSSFPRWAVEKIAIVPITEKDPGLRRWSIDIEKLREFSLLEAAIGDGPSHNRYSLTKGVREYVILRAGPDAMEPHLHRAASLYLAYAMQYAEDRESLLLEEEGMIAGMDWACRVMEADEDASRMVCLYAWSLARPGSYLEGRPEMMIRWLEAAVRASGHLRDGEAEAAFRRHLAEVCANQPD